MKKPKLLAKTGAIILVLLGIIHVSSLVSAYETLQLHLKGDDGDVAAYRNFMADLRREIPVQGRVHGIPLLHEENHIHESKQFIEVEIFSRSGKSVILAISVVDLRIVGFRLPNSAGYLASDSKPYARRYVFEGAEQQSMTATGSYEELEKTAGETRSSLKYSLKALADSVDALNSSPNDKKQQAVSMLNFNLAISDALRFTDLQRYVEIFPDANPTELQIARLNNWHNISTLILAAQENGVFPTPIEILGVTYAVVNDLIDYLGFILFTCQPSKEDALPVASRSIFGFLKSKLPSGKSASSASAYPECPRSEVPVPTRILGIDGLCVDVKDYRYEDGNPVIAHGCHGGDNQQWSLERDGTIRCQGKCLTSFKDSTIAQMFAVLSDCKDPNLSANHWEVNSDTGEIMNLESGLFLTAKKWADGELEKVVQQRKFTLWQDAVEINQDLNEMLLSLEPRNFTLNQGWDISNDTEPKVSTIAASSNRCVQRDDKNLLLAECKDGDSDKEWIFQTDGSIRPKDDGSLCVTCDETFESLLVSLSPCNSARKCQRWEVKSDGTIRSFQTVHGLVVRVQVKQQIFISVTGGPDPLEIWFINKRRQVAVPAESRNDESNNNEGQPKEPPAPPAEIEQPPAPPAPPVKQDPSQALPAIPAPPAIPAIPAIPAPPPIPAPPAPPVIPSGGSSMPFGQAPPPGGASMSFGPAPPPGGGSMSFGQAPPPGGGSMSFGPAPPPGGGSMSFGPAPPPGGGSMSFGPAPPPGGGSMAFGPAPPPGGGSKSFGPAPPPLSGGMMFRSDVDQDSPDSLLPKANFGMPPDLPTPPPLPVLPAGAAVVIIAPPPPPPPPPPQKQAGQPMFGKK